MNVSSILRLRELEKADLAACSSIYTRAWNSTFPTQLREIGPEEFSKETEYDRTIVAVLDAQVVGFVSFFESEAFIHLLFIEPKLQRAGVGTLLIRQVNRICEGRILSLKCLVENRVAINFYLKLGFSFGTEKGIDQFGEWVRLLRTN